MNNVQSIQTVFLHFHKSIRPHMHLICALSKRQIDINDLFPKHRALELFVTSISIFADLGPYKVVEEKHRKSSRKSENKRKKRQLCKSVALPAVQYAIEHNRKKNTHSPQCSHAHTFVHCNRWSADRLEQFIKCITLREQ